MIRTSLMSFEESLENKFGILKMINMKSFLKFSFFILFIGCSVKSIVIPNATYFIADRIGGKYDFYYSQEKVFKASLDELLKESTEELQKLKVHIEKINISEYDLAADLNTYSPLYYGIAKKVNRILAKPFSEFNKSQQKELFEVLEDDNETILNRSRRDRSEEIAKRFEFFFDKLTEKQLGLIKSHIKVFQNVNKIRLQNSLITQTSLKKTYLIEDIKLREKEIIKIFDENLNEREPLSNLVKVATFCTQFFKTLSPEQQKYFKNRQTTITQWIQALIEHYK